MIIIMLFLLTDSTQKLKLEKIQENNSLLCEQEISSATKTSCFIKNTKNKLSSKWLVEMQQISF